MTHALRADGFDASEDGTGRGTPLVPVNHVREVGVYRCADCEREYPALGSTDPASPRVQLDGFMLLANRCPSCGGDSDGTVNYPPKSFGAEAEGDGLPVGAFMVEQNTQCSTPDLPSLRSAETPNYAVAIPIQEVGKRTGASTDDPRAGIGIGNEGDPMYTLQAGAQHGVLAFSSKDHGADAEDDLSPTLRAGGHAESHANAGVPPAIAFNLRGREGGAMPEVTEVASLRAASGGSSRTYIGVRRLLPVECARLQGFPDDYLDIEFRGKPAADGPKYRALGNSMAVPVMAWIGRRIMEVANERD